MARLEEIVRLLERGEAPLRGEHEAVRGGHKAVRRPRQAARQGGTEGDGRSGKSPGRA
ncbi:MAG: exodeoxyribonuclease VII small subunit [Butyricicoccaceae bacterium]